MKWTKLVHDMLEWSAFVCRWWPLSVQTRDFIINSITTNCWRKSALRIATSVNDDVSRQTPGLPSVSGNTGNVRTRRHN